MLILRRHKWGRVAQAHFICIIFCDLCVCVVCILLTLAKKNINKLRALI